MSTPESPTENGDGRDTATHPSLLTPPARPEGPKPWWKRLLGRD